MAKHGAEQVIGPPACMPMNGKIRTKLGPFVPVWCVCRLLLKVAWSRRRSQIIEEVYRALHSYSTTTPTHQGGGCPGGPGLKIPTLPWGPIPSQLSNCGVAHLGRTHAPKPKFNSHFLQYSIWLHQEFYGFISGGGVGALVDQYFMCIGSVMCIVSIQS